MKNRFLCVISLFYILFGCDNPTTRQIQTPHAVSRDDIGYYCNMIVENHTGPKGQILLSDREKAIWFTSVRDALAFTLLPDEPKNIAAFFVTVMDEGEWEHPEKQINSWHDAQMAWYVINSSQRGGMGQMELIPFKQQKSANDFVELNGGEVVAYPDIPEDYVLGNTQLN